MMKSASPTNETSAVDQGHNIIARFQSAVESFNGAMDDAIHADGKIHRFKAANDKNGQLSGWYVLHLDGIPAGSYGNWKIDEVHNWCFVDRKQLSPTERAAIKDRARRQRKQAEHRREQRQKATSEKARNEWANAAEPDPKHAYLRTKLVKPYRLRQTGNCLLVPLVDGEALVNLQRIFPDGTKRFLPGGKVRGCYSPIGNADGPLYICEGWATGATIHELTGRSVACAMNAGNLMAVALLLRQRYPGRHIIIAGDNDRHTNGNPGKTAAFKAVKAIGAEYMIPAFPDDLPGTDYNDLYRLEAEGKL